MGRGARAPWGGRGMRDAGPGGGGGGVTGVTSLNAATGPVKFHPIDTVLTVAALAALSSAAVDGYGLGSVVYVQSVGDWFGLKVSAAATDAITVVNATNRAGAQWTRLGLRNRAWEQRTTWLVDPQNGAASDENTGLAGAPLKTMFEVSRRLASAVLPSGQVTTVTLASDCANTDKVVWTWTVAPGAATSTGLVVVGTPTVVYTGSLTSPFVQQTTGNIAAANDNEMTDTAVAVSYTAAGLTGALLYQRTNSTACAWWPLKDLGAKTLRMSDALDATATTVIALGNGDTYTVSRLPKVYDQHFATLPGRIAYVKFQLCDDNSSESALPIISAKTDSPSIIFDRCSFSTGRLLANARLLNCGQYANCAMTAPGLVRVDGGARVTASALTVTNGCVLAGTATCHFQGSPINMSSQGNGGAVFAFYDCPAGAFTVVTGSAILNNIKGVGNAGPLINARDYSAMIGYNSVVQPPAVFGSIVSGSLYQCGNAQIPGTSSNAVPVTAELTTRGLGIVPF